MFEKKNNLNLSRSWKETQKRAFQGERPRSRKMTYRGIKREWHGKNSGSANKNGGELDQKYLALHNCIQKHPRYDWVMREAGLTHVSMQSRILDGNRGKSIGKKKTD